MLKTILSISGKPGLYKLVTQGKNMLIVESLIDKKKIPYTETEEEPLYKVLTSIKEKEEGKACSCNAQKANPEELREYMAGILPNFDRERVYPSDIRKLITWYNLLIKAGITDFAPENEPVAETDSAEK